MWLQSSCKKANTEYIFIHQYLIILPVTEKQRSQTAYRTQIKKKSIKCVAFTSVSDASDIENEKSIKNPVKRLRWIFLGK